MDEPDQDSLYNNPKIKSYLAKIIEKNGKRRSGGKRHKTRKMKRA